MSELLSCVCLLLLFNVATAFRALPKRIGLPDQRRQNEPLEVPSTALASTTTTGGVLTYVTPSPGATLVPVTKQSQLVTSYVPQYTLCELPPIAEVYATPIPSVRASAAPYANYSVSIPTGTGSCTTIFSPTETMVCATTLDGIATKYTISQCQQDLTFSTNYGYILATPTIGVNSTQTMSNVTNSSLITPAPTIQTLTSYYLAPWQDLTTAGPPDDVDMKICTTYANGTEECIVKFYVWQTSLLTITTSTITSINLTTTISGPSQIIVETFSANVTEQVTTFSMSTTMALEYTLETETTSTSTRAGSISTEPTVYETFTVAQASQTSNPSTRSTTTEHITVTIHGGTTTETLSSFTPSATPSSQSIDAASLLGLGS